MPSWAPQWHYRQHHWTVLALAAVILAALAAQPVAEQLMNECTQQVIHELEQSCLATNTSQAVYAQLLQAYAKECQLDGAKATRILVPPALQPWVAAQAHLFSSLTGIPINVTAMDEASIPNALVLSGASAHSAYHACLLDGDDAAQLAADQALVPLEAYIAGDKHNLAWTDVHPVLRASATFSNATFGLPLDGDTFLMYYRRDVFEQRGLSVPRTWEQVLEAATSWADTAAKAGRRLQQQQQQLGATVPRELEADQSSDPTYGLCVDTIGCSSSVLLSAIAASVVQLQGPSHGWYLDPDPSAAQPLILNNSAVLGHTLRLLASMRAVGPAGQAACGHHAALFSAGRCLITFGWGAGFRAMVDQQGAAAAAFRGGLGVAQLPGSSIVLDRRSGELVAARPGMCKDTVQIAPSDDSLVACRAPLLAHGGRLAAVSALQVDQSAQQAGFQFISYLASPAALWAALLPPYAVLGPARTAAMSEQGAPVWQQAGFHPADFGAYSAALLATYNSANIARDIHSPGSEAMRLDMEDLLQACLVQRRLTLEDAAAELANRWHAQWLQRGYNIPAVQALSSGALAALQRAAPDVREPVAHVRKEGNKAPWWAIFLAVLGGIAFGVVFFATRKQLRRIIRPSSYDAFGRILPPAAGPETSLVVTDIEGSTEKWESLPSDVMDAAIALHHALARKLMLKFKGYESATEGDSFIIAFQNAHDAACFSARFQLDLMTLPWPQELLALPGCEPTWMCKVEAASRRPRTALFSGIGSDRQRGPPTATSAGTTPCLSPTVAAGSPWGGGGSGTATASPKGGPVAVEAANGGVLSQQPDFSDAPEAAACQTSGVSATISNVGAGSHAALLSPGRAARFRPFGQAAASGGSMHGPSPLAALGGALGAEPRQLSFLGRTASRSQGQATLTGFAAGSHPASPQLRSPAMNRSITAAARTHSGSGSTLQPHSLSRMNSARPALTSSPQQGPSGVFRRLNTGSLDGAPSSPRQPRNSEGGLSEHTAAVLLSQHATDQQHTYCSQLQLVGPDQAVTIGAPAERAADDPGLAGLPGVEDFGVLGSLLSSFHHVLDLVGANTAAPGGTAATGAAPSASYIKIEPNSGTPHPPAVSVSGELAEAALPQRPTSRELSAQCSPQRQAGRSTAGGHSAQIHPTGFSPLKANDVRAGGDGDLPAPQPRLSAPVLSWPSGGLDREATSESGAVTDSATQQQSAAAPQGFHLASMLASPEAMQCAAERRSRGYSLLHNGGASAAGDSTCSSSSAQLGLASNSYGGGAVGSSRNSPTVSVGGSEPPPPSTAAAAHYEAVVRRCADGRSSSGGGATGISDGGLAVAGSEVVYDDYASSGGGGTHNSSAGQQAVTISRGKPLVDLLQSGPAPSSKSLFRLTAGPFASPSSLLRRASLERNGSSNGGSRTSLPSKGLLGLVGGLTTSPRLAGLPPGLSSRLGGGGGSLRVESRGPSMACMARLAPQQLPLQSVGDTLCSKWRTALHEDEPEAELVFRGLRVRIGIHTGIVPGVDDVQLNRALNRMQYSGPALQLAKAVGDCANGGQVLMSGATFTHLAVESLKEKVMVLHMGEHHVKTELPPVSVYCCCPRELLGRLPPLRSIRSKQQHSLGVLEAPARTVCIVFMHVVGAMSLLDWNPELGHQALAMFRDHVTLELIKHNGYVVEAVDGLVLASFASASQGLSWVLKCQADMTLLPWPEELLAHENCEELCHSRFDPATGISSEVVLFRGIRLKAGIDAGRLRGEINCITGRMSYRGRVMNRAARIVAAAGTGQVLASAEAWALCCTFGRAALAGLTAQPMGQFNLKGVAEPMEIYSIRTQSEGVSTKRASLLLGSNADLLTMDELPISDPATAHLHAASFLSATNNLLLGLGAGQPPAPGLIRSESKGGASRVDRRLSRRLSTVIGVGGVYAAGGAGGFARLSTEAALSPQISRNIPSGTKSRRWSVRSSAGSQHSTLQERAMMLFSAQTTAPGNAASSPFTTYAAPSAANGGVPHALLASLASVRMSEEGGIEVPERLSWQRKSNHSARSSNNRGLPYFERQLTRHVSHNAGGTTGAALPPFMRTIGSLIKGAAGMVLHGTGTGTADSNAAGIADGVHPRATDDQAPGEGAQRSRESQAIADALRDAPYGLRTSSVVIARPTSFSERSQAPRDGNNRSSDSGASAQSPAIQSGSGPRGGVTRRPVPLPQGRRASLLWLGSRASGAASEADTQPAPRRLGMGIMSRRASAAPSVASTANAGNFVIVVNDDDGDEEGGGAGRDTVGGQQESEPGDERCSAQSLASVLSGQEAA